MHSNDSTQNIASVRGVSRAFGTNLALDNIDLEVEPGESLGLLGPNGAGKTTLISLVTGQRRPDVGEVRLFGLPPHEPQARLRLGVTPQATSVPQNLTVGEVTGFIGAHFPTPVPTPELLERFGLTGLRSKQCGGLSGGQQRRLLVALALVGRPDLVVLDEPTTGLDVEAREALWAALAEYQRGGGTLLLTSHYLAEIEALADRVVVVNHGRVIAAGSVREITARVDVTHVDLVSTVAPDVLGSLPGVLAVERSEDRVRLATRDSDATVRTLVQRGLDFSELRVAGATLEDAFLAITNSSAP